MARLALVSGIVCFGAACAVGAPAASPFGGGTGEPTDDDDGESSGGTDTDPLSTISDTIDTTMSPTTTGVLPTEGSSGSSESGGSTTSEGSSSGESSSSGGESSSSTGGIGEYELCASTNTLTACGTAGASSEPYSNDLPCSTSGPPDVFDIFVVNVSAGACVHVEADNTGGDADLTAYVVDVNGDYYGLEPDYSELDDEIPCTTVPWDGFACPSAGVTAAVAGPITIGVAQWDTAAVGCSDGAPYTLWVAVDGSDIDLTEALVLDDYAIDPLMCP